MGNCEMGNDFIVRRVCRANGRIVPHTTRRTGRPRLRSAVAYALPDPPPPPNTIEYREERQQQQQKTRRGGGAGGGEGMDGICSSAVYVEYYVYMHVHIYTQNPHTNSLAQNTTQICHVNPAPHTCVSRAPSRRILVHSRCSVGALNHMSTRTQNATHASASTKLSSARMGRTNARRAQTKHH